MQIFGFSQNISYFYSTNSNKKLVLNVKMKTIRLTVILK
jgi:hypothetical protein